MKLTLTSGQQRFLWCLVILMIAIRAGCAWAYPLPTLRIAYAEIARKMLETQHLAGAAVRRGVPFW
jgi:hypothetical protein